MTAPASEVTGYTPRHLAPRRGLARAQPRPRAMDGARRATGTLPETTPVGWRRVAHALSVGSLTRGPRALLPMGVGFVLAAGCAERRLVTAPSTPPTASTWTSVWIAAAVIAAVLGVLLTLPAWRQRGGATIAVIVLSIQAGAVALGGAVLSSVAMRSWQLLDRPVEEAPAIALLRLSRVDGDTRFLWLMVVFVVVVAALLVTVLSLAAQFARGSDPLERTVACGVLAVQLGGCAYAAVRLLLGAEGWAYLGATALLPVVAVAFASCWPSTEGRPTTGLRARRQLALDA